MADQTGTRLSGMGLVVGDRSQGYEVAGASSVDGLSVAYRGTDTRQRGSQVSLLLLSPQQDQSAVFDAAKALSGLRDPLLIGARTVVRFGGGLAAVISAEENGPLNGETLAAWLRRAAPITPAELARRMGPLLTSLQAMHERGFAHGMISSAHILVGTDGVWRLIGPWLPDGGEPEALVKATQAPESLSRQAKSIAGDIYSLSALLAWALSGTMPADSEKRTASLAQQDADPLVPLSLSAPQVPASLAALIDRGMRLHPATRPQSVGELIAALGATAPGAAAPGAAAPVSGSAAPPPLPTTRSTPPPVPSPWSRAGANPVPPPLPTGQGEQQAGSVPPIARTPTVTGRIGERPPSVPSTGVQEKKKKRWGLPAILTFIMGLGLAWYLASAGDEPPSVPASTPTQQTPRDSAPVPQQPDRPTIPVDAPRKGLATQPQEDQQANRGVLEQFCDSLFTFEAARGGGELALRAYVQRCEGFDSDYVDRARQQLGLSN